MHRAKPDVVAVKGDVYGPERHIGPLDLCEHRGELHRKGHATGLEPDDDHVGEPPVSLHDLMGDAHEGPSDLVGVHDLCAGNKNAPRRARRSLSVSHSGSSRPYGPLWTRFTSEASLYRLFDRRAGLFAPFLHDLGRDR